MCCNSYYNFDDGIYKYDCNVSSESGNAVLIDTSTPEFRFAIYTTKELKIWLSESEQDENYEECAELIKEIERRNIKQHESNINDLISVR